MQYYNKIGLLILNKDQNKFLVCEKAPDNVTSDYIMPGGQFEENKVEECLQNEIKEELNCDVNLDSLNYISDYEDIAAGDSVRHVRIKLYQGKVIGELKPSTEIKFIHWIGKNDLDNPKLSPIIKNKILPDLIRKGLLK